MELTPDQQSAFDKFKIFNKMAGGGFFLLQGPAGSGKSFMLDAILQEIKKSPSRVALAASTHKAAKVMADFVDCDVATSHSLLGMAEVIGRDGDKIYVPGRFYLEKAEQYNTHIIDECSMVADSVFNGYEELYTGGKKIMYVGDAFQIPPVNHRNSLPFDIETQRELNFTVASLTQVVRQAAGSPIIQTATDVRNNIFRPVLPFDYKDKGEGLQWVRYAKNNPSNELSDDVLDMFAGDQFRNNPDYCKVLAWRNDTVDDYNDQIRRRLFGENIPKLMVGEKLTADAPFMEDRTPLIRNNEDMEILSLTVEQDQVGSNDFLTIYKVHVKVYGMRGATKEVVIPIIHEDSEKQFNEYLNLLKAVALREKKGSFASKSKWMDYYKFKERYAATKYSYAMTVHKSQGSTYDHAVVCLWDIQFNRNTHERNRIIYTAVTRPKYSLKIIH